MIERHDRVEPFIFVAWQFRSTAWPRENSLTTAVTGGEWCLLLTRRAMGPGMVAVFERPPPWGRQGYFPVYNFEHQCQPLLASTRGSHQGCPVRLLCRGAMLSFATMQAISPFNCLSCARYVLRGPRIKVTDRRPGRCKSSHVDLQPHEARKPRWVSSPRLAESH